ncbi:hypothetical protein FB567DRAFT_1242, partial [Paraphoma chrysanthemicola]
SDRISFVALIVFLVFLLVLPKTFHQHLKTHHSAHQNSNEPNDAPGALACSPMVSIITLTSSTTANDHFILARPGHVTVLSVDLVIYLFDIMVEINNLALLALNVSIISQANSIGNVGLCVGEMKQERFGEPAICGIEC